MISWFPHHGVSDTDRLEHTGLVVELAQPTDAVSIGALCTIWPAVHHVQRGEEVHFKNVDAIAHTIAINEDYTIAVSAYSTRSILLPQNPTGAGIFGYGCDESGHAAGILYVSL